MSATVTAAVVRSEGAPFVLEQLELSDPRPTEVRVRIIVSGICHTDILIQEGDFPAVPTPVVLGHEGAGVVEEIGSTVTSVKVGDRVALSYASCGGCLKCMTGQPFHCAGFFPHNFLSAREDGSTALTRDGQ